ncbi:MAG: DUF4126 domain-containing protein, partial [Euryarchaeota archaeon]|nr:DUF4126 domain-containing protein [Euryarchaeota archaeon]
DPIVQWALAIIAGGGVAGSVQVGTVATRALSTMTTGGLGNPIVSTVEAGACITCALLAVFLPLIALIISILMVVYAIKFFKTRQSKKSNELPV